MKPILVISISNVIDKLLSMPILLPCKKGKPGELVNKLTKEEREVLAKATSKDFYHRIK